MQDIPVFTTEYGAASLVLREIPYRRRAYIHLQASLEPEKLLAECVSFARMAGAETVFATGHELLERHPLHTEIWSMSCLREGLPDTDASLFPVTEATLEQWRNIYNDRMQGVDQAAYLTLSQAKQLLAQGGAYFVHRAEEILGIGIASGENVRAVASYKPGCGKDTLLALNHALFGERITVEVASTNQKALRLYTRLGFIPTAKVASWYQIL